MGKMEEQFTGMMITLKKRMVCTNHDDTAEFQYLMFGHYDGADIICTNQWYQLRPKGVASYGGNVDVEDSFWDKYTLKLYFPRREICKSLEKDGFEYEIWGKLGYYKENKMECDTIQREYPFLSIAMINLSKKCVELEDDLIVQMQLAIIESAKKANVELREIHCAIMPSIGYADFILLFLSNDLKKVITVLDNLRKEFVDDGENDYAMLSNSYAISGFAKAGLGNLQNLKELEDSKLSIRVNLRDGVSASQFKEFFDQEVKAVLKENKKSGGDAFGLYQVFGNSDCLVLSDMPFGFFIPLYYDAKLLNPAHKLFDNYVQNTHSSIRVGVDLAEKLQLINNDVKQDYIWYREKFQGLISKLKHFVEVYDFPIRTVNGLQTIMKAYLSLVQFSHCFDIEKVVGKAFEVVADNVEKTLELLKGSEREVANWYSEQMMTALKIFREKIEDYLADLRRSDCLFIEGQSLSHPSIGSATKLLFFYNCYINDMAEKLVTSEIDGGKRLFTFLVTSGGCDVTTAYDLFSYMDPVKELEHSLIIISIPEMSLYDFRGTMFRLLHECFHFCGERKRKDRLEAFLKGLSAGTAQVIGNGLEKSFEQQKKNIYGLAKKYYCSSRRAQIKEQGDLVISKEVRKLIKKIEEKLSQLLKEEFQKRSSDIYYGRNVFSEAISILGEIVLNPNMMKKEESFLRYTYHELMICQSSVAEALIIALKEWSILFSDANILKETSMQKLEMEQRGRFDREEELLIKEIFMNYIGDIAWENGLVSIGEDERTTMKEVVSTLQELYKECYADCMAAKMLQLPVEDFLLCFLYETWNYEKAFPDMFRLAIELKMLYQIRGKLGTEVRQKLEAKVFHWEKRGFRYNHHGNCYIENVCDWIDGLLKAYEGTYNFQYVGMKYVEEYIDKTLKFYDGKFSKTTAKISKLSNMESPEEFHKLLDQVRMVWKNLAEKEKDCV